MGKTGKYSADARQLGRCVVFASIIALSHVIMRSGSGDRCGTRDFNLTRMNNLDYSLSAVRTWRGNDREPFHGAFSRMTSAGSGRVRRVALSAWPRPAP